MMDRFVLKQNTAFFLLLFVKIEYLKVARTWSAHPEAFRQLEEQLQMHFFFRFHKKNYHMKCEKMKLKKVMKRGENM